MLRRMRGPRSHTERVPNGSRSSSLAALWALRAGDRRGLTARLLARRPTVREWVDFLVAEKLAVHAHALLADAGLAALVAGAAGDPLRDQWRRQQSRDAGIARALAAIDACFRRAGIVSMPLKGIGFGERFYGGPGRRFTWDLDILVRRRDAAAAFAALEREGFRRPPLLLGLERFAPAVTHAVECRDGAGGSVDLHWTLRRLPGLRLDEEGPWRAARTARVGGVECLCPSDEDALLVVLLGIAADVDRSLCGLRSLWDASMAIEAMADADWEAFLDRRREDRSLGLVVNALSLVLHGLDCAASFPALVRALDRHAAVCSVPDPAAAERILGRPPHSLENHRLFARWQPLSRGWYAPWWVGTLPARAFFAQRI